MSLCCLILLERRCVSTRYSTYDTDSDCSTHWSLIRFWLWSDFNTIAEEVAEEAQIVVSLDDTKRSNMELRKRDFWRRVERMLLTFFWEKKKKIVKRIAQGWQRSPVPGSQAMAIRRYWTKVLPQAPWFLALLAGNTCCWWPCWDCAVFSWSPFLGVWQWRAWLLLLPGRLVVV